MNNQYADILNAVIENGLVLTAGDEFDRESLIVEIEFEANERGLSDEEIKEAVAFAIAHSRNQ